ncbi:MAG: flagellar basal body-associated FliL family protein [Planctomycetaceae bacterium]|jgi:flagellar basal body-associated protein FliL|nr:flagellar basal body-associated FliL family protein [Planctomycetaceae bacterium]
MAKEQKVVEPVAANQVESEQQNSLLGSRLIVILALVVLALAQMIIMYMMLPNTETIANSIAKTIPQIPETLEVAGIVPQPATSVDTRNWVEKKLGEQFKYQNKNKTDPTVYDQLTVTITVRIDRKDESKFDRVMVTRTEKLRDIVYTVLRGAKEDELTAPDLLSIKQKIMTHLNQELGQPFIKEVLLTDMSYSTS